MTYVHDPKRLFDLDESLVSGLSLDERALYEFALDIDDNVADEVLMIQLLGRVN